MSNKYVARTLIVVFGSAVIMLLLWYLILCGITFFQMSSKTSETNRPRGTAPMARNRARSLPRQAGRKVQVVFNMGKVSKVREAFVRALLKDIAGVKDEDIIVINSVENVQSNQPLVYVMFPPTIRIAESVNDDKVQFDAIVNAFGAKVQKPIVLILRAGRGAQLTPKQELKTIFSFPALQYVFDFNPTVSIARLENDNNKRTLAALEKWLDDFYSTPPTE
jgi:hypothetical protein